MGIGGKIKEALGLNGHDERQSQRDLALEHARVAQREAQRSRESRELLVMEIQHKRRMRGFGRD